MRLTPAFSTPALSTPAIMPVPHFPLPHFQSARCKMSVRLSHAGIVPKRLKVSLNVSTVRYPHHSSFPYQTFWHYSDRGLPNRGVEYRGMKKSRFSTNISVYCGNDTRYSHSYRGMEIGNVHKLSNGTIFNDLEGPITKILRSHHYLTLTISETVRDT